MKLIDSIKSSLFPSKDYIFDEVVIKGRHINLIYNEILCDTKSINEYVLYRLTKLKLSEFNHLENSLSTANVLKINNYDIIDYLNNGFLIIIYKKVYAIELRTILDRGITTIQSELSLSGPKDSFSENFNTNLGLIRRRLKSSELKSETMDIGKISKTKVGILYVDNIVKKNLVEHVKKNLNKINIDGIIDSSYLKNSLENKFNLFPTLIMTERPDKCSMALLEGKVVIIVDNSPYALILPSFFMDFFHTTDDYFQKSFNTTFIRVIRLIAFLIAIFIPALYISITTRNYNLVPLDLLLVLKAGRTFVPFPAYIEALFMIICFEILKESDLRMSATSGSAISILGGLILGDAAVAAGIVSPIMIIVIAISSIAGLIFTSIELGNAIRTYKILILILGTIFGIYGVILGGIIILFNLLTTETFGYNYLNFDRYEIKDSIIKIDTRIRRRNTKLSNNVIRGKYK
ncbi:MAG: spore germination protein [Bacilli bacterium]|nr:spore germination protein [Bacilli bacterium]